MTPERTMRAKKYVDSELISADISSGVEVLQARPRRCCDQKFIIKTREWEPATNTKPTLGGGGVLGVEQAEGTRVPNATGARTRSRGVFH